MSDYSHEKLGTECPFKRQLGIIILGIDLGD